MTFAGCYLRRIGGWVAVADLIALLSLVGVSEPAVRQAIRRLRSRGFVHAERRGGVAGYALTPAGAADLEPGDERIFRYGQASVDDGWVLAVFSVPESERGRRHRLRSHLGWLGFGTVGSGVWAAPAGLADAARQLLSANGLGDYVTWFHARALDPVDASSWWDLEALRAQYLAFTAQWEPLTGTDSAGGRGAAQDGHGAGDGHGGGHGGHDGPRDAIPDGAGAFAHYVRLVDSWRLFPRIDPGLPAELLPDDWPGPRAWEIFASLRERWEEPGLAHVAAVTGRRIATGGASGSRTTAASF